MNKSHKYPYECFLNPRINKPFTVKGNVVVVVVVVVIVVVVVAILRYLGLCREARVYQVCQRYHVIFG